MTEAKQRGRFRRSVSTVRGRVVLSAVILLAISGLITVLIVQSVLRVRLSDEVDSALVQEVGEFRRLAAGIDPTTGEPFAGQVKRIFDVFLSRNIPDEEEQLIAIPADGPPRIRAGAAADVPPPPQLESWRGITSSERGEIETPDGTVRYLAVPVQYEGGAVGTFAVAFYLADEEEEITEAVRVVALVALLVLIGGSAAAFLLAARVVAPVREMRDAARTVTGADMTKRIEVRGDDELAELGRTFNLMLDRLQLAFSSQRAFIRDAGHELRTPIAIVRGHLELLAEEDRDSPERRQSIDLLFGELDRMTRFVNDMLLLAKAERPDFLALEQVDLGALCDEALVKSSALGERTWSLAEGGGGTIVGDGHRLTQALINLAGNAVANSLPGERISLGCRMQGGSALLWVEDEGRGIDPSELSSVMEPFRRGRGARYEGSGLGLPIVAAIAAAHGGRVEIESELGEGTRVTLILPVAGPETDDDAEAE